MLLLALVLLLSVGVALWAFAGSSFQTGVAVAGALGGALLGLAVFRRVWREPLWRGAAALLGAQAVYLALWVAGGLLWAGPPRALPHFASPLRLSLAQLQGRWTREDGRVFILRGLQLCPEDGPIPDERAPTPSGDDPCLDLMRDPDGGVSLRVDDLALTLRAYRLWGKESLRTDLFSLNFSRPLPPR